VLPLDVGRVEPEVAIISIVLSILLSLGLELSFPHLPILLLLGVSISFFVGSVFGSFLTSIFIRQYMKREMRSLEYFEQLLDRYLREQYGELRA
jgi:Na+/H+ antiporter NhaC